MKYTFYRYLLFPLACLLQGIAQGQISNINWPKEITASTGEIITIYQPQPESFSGDKITGRAAVSVRKTANDEPVFGAIFFEATVATDKDNRTASLESLHITNAKFPGVEDQGQVDRLTGEIETEVPKWNIEISLDMLVASIKQENGTSGNDQFDNAPPKIIYRNKPTTLVILDGEPKIQHDNDLDADRVVNTPALIFSDGGQWNLYSGGIWYISSSILSGWTQNTQLSAKVQAVNQQVKQQEKDNNDGKDITATPQVTDILVSTEPAELLQTDGTPDFQSIQGTSLLYVSNSPNEIFKDINSQKTYVLLSGRWYNAASVEGPWTYVPSDQLPPDFANIPEGSEKDDVLSSVAGTDAAEEARMDAEIPQTAKVDRSTATTSVTYDGDPDFEPIEGTSLQLAQNSNITVILDANGNYFALDNGIWFISNSPNGPWSVANDRPKDVDRIPPSCSAYNAKYVYIYETTPDYVYVGYTPGYLGCYIYGPTIVYGTGFYYRPWYRRVFYPRPLTWGFGFCYNPWTGWSMSFGFGFGSGFMRVGFHFGAGYRYDRWFGPPMYRPPYRPRYAGGYYGSRRPSVRMTNRITVNNNRNNIYNNHRGVSTVTRRPMPVNRPAVTRPNNGNRPAPVTGNPSNRPGNNNRLPNNTNNPQPRPSRENNNVFTDRNGNIFQRDNNGNWNQRDNQTRSWKPVPQNNPTVNNMNRESQMRDRGNTRANNFNQARSNPPARPAAPPSRPAPSRPAPSRPSPQRR